MKITEICKKCGITQQELVQSLVDESKEETAIHKQAILQAEAYNERTEKEYLSLRAENEKLSELIKNDRLLREWRAIAVKLQKQKPKAEPPQGGESPLHVVRQNPPRE